MDVFEPFVSAPSTPEVSALAVYRGDLIAAGTFTQIGGAPVSFIARWAGQAWQALGSGTDGPVDALVVRGDTLFAGGIFAMAGGVAAANVAYWDGAHWGALGAGTNGAVDVLLAYGDDLVAGGLFTRAGVVTASHVAVWSGGAWRALGQGTDDWVRAAATYGGALVVGGHFMHAGGVAANHVARWNGAAWGALDLGLDDDVSALAAFGPDLIAGGRFQFAGGLPAKRIASWDGGAWHPLEGGLEATGYPISANVLALDPVGGSLYVGGFFVTAGGFPSYNIARWDSLRVVVPPRVTELSPNVPNPFSVTTRFTIQLASAGHVRFAIYDASGRRIAVLVDGDRPAGPQQVEWDGRDARRAHAPMGVYFARFEAAGVTRTRKVVLAR